MKVESLMHREVFACTPDEPMSSAARIMWEHDCGIVPVVEGKERRLVGVVTDRDLCMACLTRDERLSAMKVRSAMSPRVESCRLGDSLKTVHERMRQQQVRRIPVTDAEGRLVGIVSLNDLALRAVEAGTGQGEEREVLQTLARVSRHREPVVA